MKLQLMSEDLVLQNELKNTDLFEDVTMIFHKENLDGDCLVISDNHLSYRELQEVDFKPNQTIFYMMQKEYDLGIEKLIKTICDSKDINLIPPHLTVSQIVRSITLYFNENKLEQTNVITFFSTIGNVGTTSTCLSVAKSLSENTTAKVGVLLLNAWDHGTHQLDYRGEYLDTIKGRLKNQVISSKEEFISLFHMVEQESLYVLGGNRYTKLERLYSKDEINYLIELGKKYFDVLLIDSGYHFDNANMVQSLYESDMRFLVINQQPKAIEKFNVLYDELLYPLGYKRTDFLAIVNRFIDKTQFATPKAISNEIDLVSLTTIYEVSDSLFTEVEKKLLYDFEDEVYNDSIYNIVRSIIGHADLEIVENENTAKRKRWFSFS